MIREIDQPDVQATIKRIAVSRAREAGVPGQAEHVAAEVIAFQQAVKEQRSFFQQFGTFDPDKLPQLSPLGQRVNFLSHLARYGQQRREAIARKGMQKCTPPRRA